MGNAKTMKLRFHSCVAPLAMTPATHRAFPRVLASILAAAIWPLATSAFATARLPTLQDLDTGYSENTVSLSPDSKMVAVEENGDLTVLSYPTGRVITTLGDGQLPRWSPSGETLGFYSVRSGTMQLYVWKPGVAVRQITAFANGINPDFQSRFLGNVTDAKQYQWSPDGQTVVFASRVQSDDISGFGRTPYVLTNTTNPKLTWSGACALPSICAADIHVVGRDLIQVPVNSSAALSNQLFLVNTKSGETSQVTATSRVFYDPVWAKDGKHIVAASFVPRNGVTNIYQAYTDEEGASRGQIVKIDVATTTVSVLIDHAGAARNLALVDEDRRLAYVTSSSFLASPHVEIARVNDGVAHPAQWSMALESLHQARPGELVAEFIKDQRRWLAVLNDEEGRLLHVRPLELGLGEWVEDQLGNVLSVDLAKNLVVQPPGAKSAVRIHAFRKDDLKLGVEVPLDWLNTHGDPLSAAFLLPQDYIPGRRYPLIVDAYPLQSAHYWMHSMGGNQTWAAAGYVVFKPGERAPHVLPNGLSNPSFADRGKGPAGFEITLDDVLSGVDELARRGIIDPSRMCLYGHSNGGSAVSYLVSMTNRFKCAVVAAPAMADWVVPAVLQTGARAAMNAGSGGMDFNKDINDFVKMSAVFQLYKSRTPMLIVSGDNDPLLVDAISVYNAVRDTGTPVTLVRYPDQGHVLTGSAMADFWRRQMDFFGKYLQPDATEMK
jgi:dipeptidyl aminopeptidase/acylaminoacyl peptidase